MFIYRTNEKKDYKYDPLNCVKFFISKYQQYPTAQDENGSYFFSEKMSFNFPLKYKIKNKEHEINKVVQKFILYANNEVVLLFKPNGNKDIVNEEILEMFGEPNVVADKILYNDKKIREIKAAILHKKYNVLGMIYKEQYDSNIMLVKIKFEDKICIGEISDKFIRVIEMETLPKGQCTNTKTSCKSFIYQKNVDKENKEYIVYFTNLHGCEICDLKNNINEKHKKFPVKKEDEFDIKNIEIPKIFKTYFVIFRVNKNGIIYKSYEYFDFCNSVLI
jgi:hypothetical protein